MKFPVVVLTLAVITFFACSAGQPRDVSPVKFSISFPWTYNICVDGNFTDAETVHINAAIEEWDTALGDSINFNVYNVDTLDEESTEHCRVIINRDTSESERFSDKPKRVGLAECRGGRHVWINVWRQWNENNPMGILRETTAHEIGHALWLMHTEGGIMNFEIIPGARVSHWDALYAAYMLGVEARVKHSLR